MSEPVAQARTATHGDSPLDDVMLAMDVVDTLRRRERLVQRELDDAGREQDLRERLKRIYTQQGIDVPDHVIDQGVTALKEDRFTYKPPSSGLGRRLALIYVNRGRWGQWLGGGVAAALLAAVVNYFAFVAPEKALPETLAQRHEATLSAAQTDKARAVAEQLFAAGSAALQRGDKDAANAAIEQLDTLRARLEQEYILQIVNRPGERTGVWRIPDINQQARNYYVVVEALSPSGERVTVSVENEESGKTELTTRWAMRVDEATFEAVKRDKQDDGIVENDRFGYKRRGRLEPNYEIPTSGGAITAW